VERHSHGLHHRDNVDPSEDLRAGRQMQVDFGLTNPVLLQLLSDPARVWSSLAALSGRRVRESRAHHVAVAEGGRGLSEIS
jgi:hypothetical protein